MPKVELKIAEVEFKRVVVPKGNNRSVVVCEIKGTVVPGGTSNTVEANLLLSILEMLTVISETNKSILIEVDDIQGPPTS